MLKEKKKFSRLIGRTVRPDERGYAVGVYRQDRRNDCPGCGRCNWIVGRMMSECAFCTTAIPIENAASGSTVIQHRNMTNQSTFQLAA